jgi:cyclophilin family peptidyl-prolyl cis-trans isomerase
MLRHDLELRHSHHRDAVSPFVRRRLTAMVDQAKQANTTAASSSSSKSPSTIATEFPRPRFVQGLLAPRVRTVSPPASDVDGSGGGGAFNSTSTATVAAAAPLRNLVAVFITPEGSIVWRLLPHAAPRMVDNMVRLIHAGFFNASAAAAAAPKGRAVATLYRYEADFCMQGGGWPVKSSPFPAVKHEYDPDFPNERFAVSMARTSDPDSATTEFSMMLNDNARWLGPGGSEPHGYSVFAHVISGYGTLERLFKRETKKSGLTLFAEAVPIVAAFVVEM